MKLEEERMKTLNENMNVVTEEVGDNGQIIVCGMSCGGICLLISAGVAAAFATMSAALY